jgi:hypothetical protein
MQLSSSRGGYASIAAQQQENARHKSEEQEPWPNVKPAAMITTKPLISS